MAGRKELFCASSSPVTLSALINACCTETILQLFSLRSSCCPSDAAHAASSGQQLLLREKSFRIVSASSRRYMAGWKSYWTTISTEKLHCSNALIFRFSVLIPVYEAPLPPFFIFQNRCITRIFFSQDFWKKTFFSRISGKKPFFPGFLESAFHTGRLYFKNLF